ncbi:hypothetical protein AAFF_G00186410 [Aldrovandia affinis]|uniref:Uncharacterized protein n=1 Tax=Aldrovandia affinis TaxID=143900 RepID=A0AAD7WWD3_9TELE|nr:hypothetical protein AAFF_G00186410 [Aldrovandia affinis]
MSVTFPPRVRAHKSQAAPTSTDSSSHGGTHRDETVRLIGQPARGSPVTHRPMSGRERDGAPLAVSPRARPGGGTDRKTTRQTTGHTTPPAVQRKCREAAAAESARHAVA